LSQARVAPDVGGGFGAKFVMYPEEVSCGLADLAAP
jgi:CO/xanthine dehydrogenase Mo-binding subunit